MLPIALSSGDIKRAEILAHAVFAAADTRQNYTISKRYYAKRHNTFLLEIQIYFTVVKDGVAEEFGR